LPTRASHPQLAATNGCPPAAQRNLSAQINCAAPTSYTRIFKTFLWHFFCQNSQSPSTKICKLLICNLKYPIDAKLEVPTT
jgi:hypothetical protein